MNKHPSQTYYAIGLMSGSSLDGLDIVYVKFTLNEQWTYKILSKKTASLNEWIPVLAKAIYLSPHELNHLSIDFGHYLSKETLRFIQDENIKEIDIVVSHGHTIYHYPDKGITCQIGDGKVLANALQIPVLTNLRQADIDAGGQGAPIVPIGDKYLFSNYKFCLNIGGIANISIKMNDTIIAYDIAMANQILNYFSQKLGKAYDDEGCMAKEGKVSLSVLDALQNLAYYKKKPPKSLDNQYKTAIINLIVSYQLSTKDSLATYTAHLAKQIAAEANRYFVHDNDTILVSGGGAFNCYLLELLQKEFNGNVFRATDEIIDFKEALVMAFMGVLYLRKEINVLKSVTGASRDTICGKFYTPQ